MKIVIYKNSNYREPKFALGKVLGGGKSEYRISAIKSRHWDGYRSRIKISDVIFEAEKTDEKIKEALDILKDFDTVKAKYHKAKSLIVQKYREDYDAYIEKLKQLNEAKK